MPVIQPHNSNPNGELPLPRPLVNIALAFMTGLVYAKFFPVRLSIVIVVLMLLILVWFSWIRSRSSTPGQQIHGVMILILFAVFGTVRMETQLLSWKSAANEIQQVSRLGTQTIEGTIAEKRQTGDKRTYAVLKQVTAEKWHRRKILPGRVEFRAPVSVMKDILPGDRISFDAQVIPIRGPSLPASFDYQEFRHSQSIYASVYVKSNTPITHIDHETGITHIIRGFAVESVNRIRDHLQHHNNAGEITALIASICFGVRDETPNTLRNQLQESGLAHITSISGLHVTMVLYLFFWLMCQTKMKRKHAAWLTILMSIFYLCLVGFRIPTMRSVLMAFVLMGKHILQRETDTLNSLALAALILLLINPNELFLASFQLSFMAVFILLMYSPFDRWIETKVSFLPLQWLIRGVASSAAVVVGLAPFSVHYFHILSWGAAFGNLIAVPIVSLLLPISYVWAVTLYFQLTSISGIVSIIMTALCEALLEVINLFSHPIFWFILPGWSVYGSACLLICLLLFIQPSRILFQSNFMTLKQYQLALIAGILCMLGNMIIHSNMPLRVDFLSLGQGDCILVRSPEGRTMLIDGGSPVFKKSDYRFSRLEDFLLSQGIKKIDVMVLTHPQADHIGDMNHIANRFEVGMFLEGSEDHTSKAYTELLTTLHRNKIPIHHVKKGDSFQLGAQTQCWVMHPHITEWDNKVDINEQSVVVMMECLGKRFLFTGDIGIPTENKLCEIFDNWDIDVLKVPHHGSRYSTGKNLLEETQPEIAVIQVGSNAYGHPHQDARQRLYDVHAHVLRNDYDGTVLFQTFGNTYRIYTTRANRLYIR